MEEEVQLGQQLQNLVEDYPELIETIERHVNLIATPTPSKQSSPSSDRTTIDPTPFRRQVQQILRDGLRYLEEGWEEDPITDDILPLIQQAQELIERGDSYNALVVLQAIASSCVDSWDEVADYGADNDAIAQELDAAITEAILCADLTPQEQVDLQINLEALQDEWNVDFGMSLEALHQGWDDPQLQRILQGETQLELWENYPPHYADDLICTRLFILARQERYQEYLYLAQATGQTQPYLTMLARLGRISEAMDAAQNQMETMEEAFALAQMLRQSEWSAYKNQLMQIHARKYKLMGLLKVRDLE